MKFIERLSRKSAQQPQPADPGQAPLLMALEPRIMFDASVGAVAQDAAAQTTADAAKDSTSDSDSSQAPTATGATASQQQGSQRHEVVFIDGQVSNVGQLLEGLSANAEVVILDSSKDGLQQMADYLKGRENLDAIHLLSHGADGTVQLGNVWLASNNLAEHRAALESIGAALEADGDLMIYGCDVGQGDKGQAFIDELAAITGADVAASVDETGSAALGGNWTLERNSGGIETAALSVSGYDSLMVASYSGGTASTAPTLGTSSNLMKYVVGDFNGDGRADILFQAAGSGGLWSFAQSNSDGTFTIDSQATSIFAGLSLGDASTGGANFHAADFNGDGRTDLLAAPLSGPTMKLYLNTGSGFTSQDVTGPAFGVRTLVGDFNGDGALDILYQTAGSTSSWALAVNNGSATPTFTTVTSADGSWPFGGITLPDFNANNYKAADVDGDGYTDLIYVASAAQMKYFRNNNGVFVDMTSSAALPTTAVNRAIVADFDGDGDADILYQVNGNGSFFRYIRNDNGTFVDVDQASSPFAGVVLPDMSAQQFRVGDIDGDGDLDLVVTSSTANSTSIFYQSGSLPKLISSTPADNSLTVTPSANITLTFDQSVAKGTGNIYIVRTSDNTIIQTIDVSSGAVTGSGTTWTIDPPADMVAGVGYAVRIDNKTFANANGQVYKGVRDNTTLNFTVTAVAAPVIGNFNGDAVSYTEKGSAVLIDQGTNAVVTDADSSNFSGGSVRVSVTGGAVSSEDVLSVLSLGTAAGQISVTGSTVLYGGVAIGALTGGTGGNALVITLNANADAAAVTALVRSLQYSNSNTATPTTTARTVSITVTDETGTTSAAAAVTVNILAINDAPVISTPTNVTVTEDTQSPVTGIILSDVDSGSGTLTLTVGAGTLSGTSGSGVTVGGTGSALTLSGTLTAINNFIAAGSLKYTPALNSNTSVTLGLSLDTASVGTDTRNLTLDITPVNDAPTISGPVSINVTEDVAKSMAGITFGDVDAGTGSVRVIFSVANGNGTFTGTASSGVTITNNGTNAITLEGTVADINTMVSNGRLTYLGALNATGVKTMSISINDNGNTGSGGALQVNANISLVIASVNDAPVNNLPGPQSVPQDGSLVFNSANGNLITITDVDVGGNVMTLSLNAAQGQMTLGSTVGLSFSTGDGTNDTSMTFTGTLAAINAALNGLTFTPQAGYNGTGAITIESNDQGYSGSGGVKSDVDTLLITIAPINPKVTGVVATPSSDGANKVGDMIDIVVNFDNAVVVDQTSGSPTLLLDTGVIDRQAVYVGGSGSNQLTFRYIVQAGDVSADLDYASTAALSLNGAVMQSTQGYAAILTLPTVGGADSLGGRSNIVVDGVVPVVGSVSVPVNGTYITGQNLDFTVNFSEAVSVDTTGGTPRIAVTLDTGGTAYADYVSGNGTSALVFRLVVASGQLDSNGITLGSSIDTNGGVITDTAGNATVTTLSGVASTAGVKVDGIAPSVVNVIPPIDGSYKAGDVLSFTVNTSEDVVVDTIGGTPRLVLTVGGVTRYATYVSGAASGELVFQYTVQSGDTAASGISVNGTLDLNGGQVNDTAGNALNLNLGALGNTGNVLVDTTTPYATNITRVDATPTNSGSVSYTVTFSENVRNVDATDFNLIFGGSVAGSIESVTAVDGHTFTVKVSGLTGTGTVRLDLRPGTDIADAAGNLVPGGHVGVSYSIDRDAPSVASVSVPAAGTYVAGAQLDFVVNTDEAVLVDNGNGNPRLAITLDNGRVVYADYLSGSGGNDLVFRLNVTSGMSGNTTFAVAPSIDLNGGSIRDARGNDANAGLNNVGDTRGILVDAKAPRPSSIVVDGPVQPTDRTLNFTLTFDEAVSGVDLNDFSVISTGSASGTLQSVQQIDAKTYRITVGSISGAGTLALSLNALNSGIQDQVGNDLVVSLVGQSQTLQPQTIQPQGAGDLNYRTNPPETLDTPQGPLLQPQLPGFVATEVVSPLAAPGLFDVRTVGGSLQPLGTIFLGNGSSAPSFIAQVFGSSDGGIGGSQGSFGGGEGSVFGSSTFAGIFSRDVPGVSEMNVFNGSQWKQSDLNQGLRGVFGAPTFGQQLNQINEADQRHVRELAMALAQPAQIGKRA